MAKRILSGLLCCLFCCLLIVPCLIVPSKALSFGFDVDFSDFASWVHSNINQIEHTIWSFFDKDVCPRSPNDNALHNFVVRHTQVDGKVGNYYVCEYCGKSAGEVGKDAYSDYTSTLPVTGYNSSGNLIWQSRLSDISGRLRIYTNQTLYASESDLPKDLSGISVSISKKILDFSTYYVTVRISNFPVAGSYRCLETVALQCRVLSSGIVYETSANYQLGSWEHKVSNQVYNLESYVTAEEFTDVTYISFNFICPVFEFIPDSSVDFSVDDTYNITTRPTSITGGNYGIVGDNGELTVITVNDSIVNEYNNTYYNPATGKGDTITNWDYNYVDRSYNVTLESGDTVTVTYGDQNITIIEGGDTYIIYYVIEGGHSDPDDPPVNSDSPSNTNPPANTNPPSVEEHRWRETSRKDPTCTLPGQINYICEYCDQLRVDVIPANGHTWTEKQHVPTTYDDDGNLIQQGYTIYECSVCGEQYKDMLGTGPPGSGSGAVDDGGLTGWLNGLIKFLSDNLSGAVELILSFFREIPEMFNGFTAFLSAMFPFLPPEITMLLTFGIAAVVFIGIIKAIRR